MCERVKHVNVRGVCEHLVCGVTVGRPITTGTCSVYLCLP